MLALIIPHYRQGRFLGDCLESVFKQLHVPAEVVVVDSSPDESRAAVRAFRRRIRHVVQPARGVAAARNRGIAETTCDLVAFLDADNLATFNASWLQIAEMQAHPDAVFCHGALLPIDENNRRYATCDYYGSEQVTPKRQLGWLLARNRIATDTVCVRRGALEAAGGFCEEEGVREDYDLWLRLAQLGPFRYIDAPLACYRRHTTNLSNDEAYMFAWEAGALRRMPFDVAEQALIAAFPDPEECIVVRGELLLRRGDREAAQAYFDAARGLWPASAAIRFHQGNLAFDRGDLATAELHLRGSLKRVYDDAAAWNNLGVVVAHLGRRDEAAAFVRRAAALSPLYLDARHNLAVLVQADEVSALRLTRRRPRRVLMPMSAAA